MLLEISNQSSVQGVQQLQLQLLRFLLGDEIYEVSNGTWRYSSLHELGYEGEARAIQVDICHC